MNGRENMNLREYVWKRTARNDPRDRRSGGFKPP